MGFRLDELRSSVSPNRLIISPIAPGRMGHVPATSMSIPELT